MSCDGWQAINPVCHITDIVVGGAVQELADAVAGAVGQSIATVGTLWVHVKTPNLTGSGGTSSSIRPGYSAPGAENIETVMGYVMWIGFAIAIAALMILGAMIATRIRSGDGVMAVGKIGLVLCSVILISASSGLVARLLPTGPVAAGGAVLFMQSGLWWYTGAAAIVSIVIGAVRMAWEQRAEHGREILRSILTLVVVAGAGTTIVALLVSAADGFSTWILNGSLECNLATDQACFGKNMTALLVIGSNPATGALVAFMVIVLGLMALGSSLVQIALMIVRSGVLVILTGVLPLAAAFTNTEMGKTWFKRCISWLAAFILYKPAAALVYAAIFQLAGTDAFSDDGSGIYTIMTGLMMMLIALVALPALLRLMTPMVGALAAGGAGGMAAAGMMAIPAGANMLGRLASGSGSDGSDGADGTSMPAGSTGTAGGTPDAGGASPQTSSTADSSGQEVPGGSAESVPSGAGSAGTSGGQLASGASAGGASGEMAGGSEMAAGASAGGGSVAGGAAAGGGAAGGAAAGGAAAGGPIGIAVGAGMEAASKVKDSAQALGEDATGEGSSY